MATCYNDTKIYKGFNKLPSSSNLFTNVHSTCCTDNIQTTVELIAMPTFLKHQVIMIMIAIIIISTGSVEWLQHAAGHRVNVSPQSAVTLNTNVPGDQSRPSPQPCQTCPLSSAQEAFPSFSTPARLLLQQPAALGLRPNGQCTSGGGAIRAGLVLQLPPGLRLCLGVVLLLLAFGLLALHAAAGPGTRGGHRAESSRRL